MLLSEQQQTLRTEVRRLLQRHADSAALRASMEAGVDFDPKLWQELAVGMGLTGIGVAESDGGAGGGWVDLALIFEELGRALAHVPFLGTVGLAAPVVVAAPPGADRSALLAAVATGARATLVGPEHSAVRATRTAAGWRCVGTAGHVVDGAAAQHLVVVAEHTADGEPVPVVLLVDASDVERRPVDTFDLTRGQAELVLSDVVARELATGADAARAVATGHRRSVLALAAEQLGVARRCLELACEHARSREQFGRPVGSFQAVKHRLADLFVAVESADAAVYNAAWTIDETRDIDVAEGIAVAIAAERASETAVRAAGDCLQVHGGMGFTWEHDTHLLLRRARASRYLLGTPEQHREELARLAGFVAGPENDTVEPPAPPGGAALDALRLRVREFLAGHLPSDWRGIGALDDAARATFLRDWRQALQEQRLLAYSWPVEHGGGGGTLLEEAVVHEECHRAGLAVWNDNDHLSIQMLGNTLLAAGTAEQCRRFLPRVLDGSDQWCQGYSEPGAGSDLASLRCEARRDGDEWVLRGQKIWTSDAARSNWIFVLARTDPEAPKHRGISFLLVPMDQQGVTVRPIRNIAGSAHFAEVFFDGARTPVANVVGPVHGGWRTAMTLVGFERGAEAATLHLMFEAELTRLLELARATGAVHDPLLRQRLARAYGQVETLRFLGATAVAALAADREPGAQAAITKLYWSEYHAEVTELAMDVLGVASTTPTGRPSRTVVRADEPGAPNSSASWTDVYLKARAGTIYAGTSEIQRSTIAERVLGLPR